MKIEIKKSLLEQILSQMQPFLEKKDMSQITSHVLLVATDNTLTTKATDYETGLRTRVEDVNIIKEGEATANGKKLLEIVRILKDKEITLWVEDDFLFITQDRSRYKLPMFRPQEFPTFPAIKNFSKIELASDTFIDSLKSIAPAIDTNNPKFELNGALIDIKQDHINFVGTDTKRLALVSHSSRFDQELSLIVPKKAIIEIQKLFFDDHEIYYDQNHIILQNEHHFFFAKLINGRFPNYERILPKSLQYTLSLPKSEMIEAIKQITIISSELKLTFKKDHILFENLNSDTMEAQTQLDVDTPFKEDFTIAINSRYILDFLSQIKTQSFEMGLNEPDLPFELKEQNFITIIMPIVI